MRALCHRVGLQDRRTNMRRNGFTRHTGTRLLQRRLLPASSFSLVMRMSDCCRDFWHAERRVTHPRTLRSCANALCNGFTRDPQPNASGERAVEEERGRPRFVWMATQGEFSENFVLKKASRPSRPAKPTPIERDNLFFLVGSGLAGLAGLDGLQTPADLPKSHFQAWRPVGPPTLLLPLVGRRRARGCLPEKGMSIRNSLTEIESCGPLSPLADINVPSSAYASARRPHTPRPALCLQAHARPTHAPPTPHVPTPQTHSARAAQNASSYPVARRHASRAASPPSRSPPCTPGTAHEMSAPSPARTSWAGS